MNSTPVQEATRQTEMQDALSMFEKNNYEMSGLLERVVESIHKLSLQPSEKDIASNAPEPIINSHMDCFNLQLRVFDRNVATLNWVKNRLQEII